MTEPNKTNWRKINSMNVRYPWQTFLAYCLWCFFPLCTLREMAGFTGVQVNSGFLKKATTFWMFCYCYKIVTAISSVFDIDVKLNFLFWWYVGAQGASCMKFSSVVPGVVRLLLFLHLCIQKSVIGFLGKDNKSRSPDACQALLMRRYCTADK